MKTVEFLCRKSIGNVIYKPGNTMTFTDEVARRLVNSNVAEFSNAKSVPTPPPVVPPLAENAPPKEPVVELLTDGTTRVDGKEVPAVTQETASLPPTKETATLPKPKGKPVPPKK